jgi:hypothetical protein
MDIFTLVPDRKHAQTFIAVQKGPSGASLETTSRLPPGRLVPRVVLHEAGTKLGELVDKFSACFR